jgi:hypothetical protein
LFENVKTVFQTVKLFAVFSLGCSFVAVRS